MSNLCAVEVIGFMGGSLTLMKNRSKRRRGLSNHSRSQVFMIFDFLSIFKLGGVILSICSGSGSMLEAALQVGRSCLSLDIDGTY